MTVEITTKDQDVFEIVEKAVEHHGNVQEELIPILSDVNRSIGYLPMAALEEISVKMKLPKSHVLSVASFYHMLFTKPVGKHIPGDILQIRIHILEIFPRFPDASHEICNDTSVFRFRMKRLIKK